MLSQTIGPARLIFFTLTGRDAPRFQVGLEVLPERFLTQSVSSSTLLQSIASVFENTRLTKTENPNIWSCLLSHPHVCVCRIAPTCTHPQRLFLLSEAPNCPSCKHTLQCCLSLTPGGDSKVLNTCQMPQWCAIYFFNCLLTFFLSCRSFKELKAAYVAFTTPLLPSYNKPLRKIVNSPRSDDALLWLKVESSSCDCPNSAHPCLDSCFL